MGRLRDFGEDHRLDIALVALLLVVAAPFVQTLTAQSSPRYALSSALVAEGDIRIDDYEPIIGVDRVERAGHLYADKAPGQPFLGAPVIGVAEALGADPATDFRVEGNLGVWSLTIAFCAIPAAILLVLMRRHARRTETATSAATAACALSFCTMLLPFASSLYAHIFVATLAFGAWHLLTRPAATSWHVVAAGVLAALASSSEYPMLYVAGVLALWTLVHLGWRAAFLFGTPHLIAIPLVLAYHQAAYDSWSTGYSAKEGEWQLSYGFPKPSHVVDILLGARGFIFTPVVLLALGVLVRELWRRRTEFLVPAATFAGFFVLQAGWPNPWGGEGPGPRYIAPALPFLVIPAARAVAQLPRRVVTLAMGIGFVSMGLVLVTYELVPEGGALIAQHLEYLGERGLNPTVFTIALGPIGWVVHLALVAVAMRWVIATWPSGEDGLGVKQPRQVESSST